MIEKPTNSEKPRGMLAIQTIAMPRETNANGDIFGGWLVSQMDLAGGVLAHKISQQFEQVTEGQFTFVAIDEAGRPRALK